MTFALSGLLK